jgi:hypothetical protein
MERLFVSDFFNCASPYATVDMLMRTRFDQFGKQMVRTALETRGPVETDAEVPADTRRIDLWFMPDPTRTSQSVPDHLGLLGRIARGPSTLEFFHDTPNGDELAACLIKHGEFRHFLSLRKAPPPIPTQWVISSGRPDAGIEGLWLRPLGGWPFGFYEGPPLLWTRLVVVNELPVARDTLLVRLLGAGSVLKQAIAELKAQDADAPERTLALPILLRLRLTVPNDPAKRTNDDKEFLMATQDIVENWRREAIQEGCVRSLVEIYEARFGAMPGDVRAVIEDTRDEATLLTWVRLASTRSVNEIAAAIRASRAS